MTKFGKFRIFLSTKRCRSQSTNHTLVAYCFHTIVWILYQLRCTTISILAQDIVTAKPTKPPKMTKFGKNFEIFINLKFLLANDHEHMICRLVDQGKLFDEMVVRFEIQLFGFAIFLYFKSQRDLKYIEIKNGPCNASVCVSVCVCVLNSSFLKNYKS